MNVLFVCLGNICRSPSADGMLRKKLAEHGLDEKVTVDSAGTGDWHIGKAPDQRSQAAAAARGYAISNLRARQVVAEDFDKLDYVLAMGAEEHTSELEHVRSSYDVSGIEQ